MKYVRIRYLGSGVVSTETDGCLSSETEVELGAQTHSQPWAGVLHNPPCVSVCADGLILLEKNGLLYELWLTKCF